MLKNYPGIALPEPYSFLSIYISQAGVILQKQGNALAVNIIQDYFRPGRGKTFNAGQRPGC
jgi:hypothetical protein